jgi:excisionase family DNA binding protein
MLRFSCVEFPMRQPEGLKPLLTRGEVAEVLGVSVQTVRRMVLRGELESRRVAKRFVRIPGESLERYLQARKEGGAA